MTGCPDPWGPQPTDEQLAAARAIAQAAEKDARRAALAGALTVEQAAARLNITPPEIAALVRAGRLAGIGDDDVLWLPAWQFTARGALPGLADVIGAWPGTPLTLTMFAMRTSPDLDGRTPAQELNRPGGLRRVLALLQAASPAGW